MTAAPSRVHALSHRAEDDLAYIRRTMEHAGSFTAVSGLGGILMGCVAVVAAVAAHQQPSPEAWLAVWLVTALVGISIGVVTMRAKARRFGITLLSGVGARFLLSFSPPIVAGAVLTLALSQGGMMALLPGLWLLLYGAGIMTGGLFSLPVLRWMGVTLMLAGVAALASPVVWGDLWMALGFGALQIGFGLLIRRRHGG